MKKIILLIVLSICQFVNLSIVRAALAEAPAFSLAVSPSILRINATPPAHVETDITIDNKSSQKQNLQLRIRNFQSNTFDGKIEYVPEDKLALPDVLIRNKIKILEGDQEVLPAGRQISSIEILPTDSKTLKLKIDIDSSIPQKDYYFSILFISNSVQSESNQQSSNTSYTSLSHIDGGIASNILLSIGAKGSINGSITDFSTDFFRTNGPVKFNLLLQNSSDHYINPSGNITITNMFGRDVGRVEIPTRYILVNSQRMYEILWPERFIFGLYRATAVVNLSDTGPIFKRSIIFVSLPIYVLFSVSLFIFILIGIYLRVKRKI